MQLPDGWKNLKLEEIACLKAGKFIPASQIKSQLDEVCVYPCFGGNGIRGYVSENSHKGLFPIIGRQGALCGNVNLATGRFYATEHAVVATSLNNNDSLWLYYALQFARLNQYATGQAQPGLSVDTINKIVFLVPPLEEQKKIAETLSTWDSAIEKMEKLIECKEKQRREIAFKLIFFKQNLWENHLLSDFLTPGNKTPVKDTSRYKKITVKLHKKGLEFNQQTREMADTRPFYIRNEGELIVGKQNFFNGSIAIVDKLHAGGICSNAIMSFEVNGINRFFLFEYLSDESYLRKHSMLANGTGQKELSEKDFLNFEVNVPSSNEQNEIAEILEVTEKELSLLNLQLALYKKQKQGLMQKLLTGEWRI